MSDDYFMMFDYNNNNIDHYTLTYSFPGSENIENALDLINYKPTSKDIATANKTFDKLLNAFKEALGTPDIFNSPISTTTYTWTTDTREIELVNYIDNEELSVIGAIDIRVNCNLQSFCKHEDVKEEKSVATCTKDGYNRTVCNTCGYVDETTYKALGHKETSKTIKKPTCTTKGEKETTCSTCGIKRKEQIDTIAHKYVDTIIIEATCTTSGSKKQICSVCDHSTKEETVSALGHSMSTVTCTQDSSCSRCGLKGEKAFGHSWEYEYWYDSSGNLQEYCRCSYCQKDYVYNINIVGKNLPYSEQYNNLTINSVYIDDRSGVFVDDTGEIVVSAWITLVTSGDDTTVVFYKIYNSSGVLIESGSETVSSWYNGTIIANLPDGDTYYIEFS